MPDAGEPGSGRCQGELVNKCQICRQAESLIICVICLPETICALNRLVREGRLTAEDYRMIRDRIFEEIEDAEICYVTPDVVDRTIRCLESSPLRAWMPFTLSAL